MSGSSPWPHVGPFTSAPGAPGGVTGSSPCRRSLQEPVLKALSPGSLQHRWPETSPSRRTDGPSPHLSGTEGVLERSGRKGTNPHSAPWSGLFRVNAQPSQFVRIRFVAEVANIYYGRLLRSRLCTERSVGEDTGSEPKALGDLPGVTWSVAPGVWPTLGACRLGLPEQTRAVRCGDRLPDGSVCCKEMLGLGRPPGRPGCTPSVRPSVRPHWPPPS